MTLDSAGDQCLTCPSNSGERRISPGETVHKGRFWVVEHAYPSGLLGWLVIVLRRHAEALHELTTAEMDELATVQRAVVEAIHAETECEKEYLMCLSEAPGFRHLHIHVVPRDPDLRSDRRGRAVFGFLRPTDEELVSEATVAAFCDRMRVAVRALLDS